MNYKNKKIAALLPRALLLTVPFASLGLVGCESSSDLSPKIIVRVVPPAAKPKVHISNKSLQHSLRKAGMSVFQVGQQAEITGKRSMFFQGSSIRLRSDMSPVLKNMALLMKQQQAHDVTITVYADHVSKKMSSITRKQASVIMNILWRHGIGAHLVVAHGDDRASAYRPRLSYPNVAYNNKVVFRFKTMQQDW